MLLSRTVRRISSRDLMRNISLSQAYALEQILESRVVAERVVDWIDLQSRQRIGMLNVRFFQPCEGLVLVPNADISPCEDVRID